MKPKEHLRIKLKRQRQMAFDENPMACFDLWDRGAHLFPSQCSVGLYYPMGHEISPLYLAYQLRKKGCRLFLPRQEKPHLPLSFHSWDVDTILEKTAQGFLAPCPEQQVEIPHILILPLLGYDVMGNRLGYGAGDYDRTLIHAQKHKKVLTIGVAFDAQEVPSLPVEGHDQKMDYLITEKRLLDFSHSLG